MEPKCRKFIRDRRKAQKSGEIEGRVELRERGREKQGEGRTKRERDMRVAKSGRERECWREGYREERRRTSRGECSIEI